MTEALCTSHRCHVPPLITCLHGGCRSLSMLKPMMIIIYNAYIYVQEVWSRRSRPVPASTFKTPPHAWTSGQTDLLQVRVRSLKSEAACSLHSHVQMGLCVQCTGLQQLHLVCCVTCLCQKEMGQEIEMKQEQLKKSKSQIKNKKQMLCDLSLYPTTDIAE